MPNRDRTIKICGFKGQRTTFVPAKKFLVLNSSNSINYKEKIKNKKSETTRSNYS